MGMGGHNVPIVFRRDKGIRKLNYLREMCLNVSTGFPIAQLYSWPNIAE